MSNYNLLPIVVAILACSYILKDYWWEQNVIQKSLHLTIIILSARDNAIKRQTIRTTWLKDAENYNSRDNSPFKIDSKFVIGKQPCSVHPIYREDPFGCKLKAFVEAPIKINNYHKSIKLQDIKPVESDKQIQNFKGFSFQLYHPIIINSIGVHHQLVQHFKHLQVLIVDAFSKIVLYQFNLSYQNERDEDFSWINVNVQLDKDVIYLITLDDSIDVENFQAAQYSSNFSTIPGRYFRVS